MKMTRNDTIHSVAVLMACVGLLMLMIMNLSVASVSADLPPRITSTPTSVPSLTPVAVEQPHDGAEIELLVDGSAMQWSDLQTIVQWQDAKGRWYNVAGWVGALDSAEATVTDPDQWQGHKTWWVDKDELDRGPFRWQVWNGETKLATSATFSLPSRVGERVVVEITL